MNQDTIELLNNFDSEITLLYINDKVKVITVYASIHCFSFPI